MSSVAEVRAGLLNVNHELDQTRGHLARAAGDIERQIGALRSLLGTESGSGSNDSDVHAAIAALQGELDGIHRTNGVISSSINAVESYAGRI